MTQFFTTSDGMKLAFHDEGAGTPLLCLAGLTRNSNDFNFVAPHLANTRLIRLDYRGRGASQWADPASYTKDVEARDVLELLDHLNLDKTAILGTSRGGMIAMILAKTAKHRLTGVILNDIGPEIAPKGIAVIDTCLGRQPPYKTFDQAVRAYSKMPDFPSVPMTRWLQNARNLFNETGNGLMLNYDPALRDAFIAAKGQPTPDRWPFFDSLNGLPVALVHGENSTILSHKTVAEMRRRRPDMIYAKVPDRGHIPFLDEVESLSAIHALLRKIQ